MMLCLMRFCLGGEWRGRKASSDKGCDGYSGLDHATTPAGDITQRKPSSRKRVPAALSESRSEFMDGECDGPRLIRKMVDWPSRVRRRASCHLKASLWLNHSLSSGPRESAVAPSRQAEGRQFVRC